MEEKVVKAAGPEKNQQVEKKTETKQQIGIMKDLVTAKRSGTIEAGASTESVLIPPSEAKCVHCDANLKIPSDTEKGELLSCSSCGGGNEVANVKKGKDGKIDGIAIEYYVRVEDGWGE